MVLDELVLSASYTRYTPWFSLSSAAPVHLLSPSHSRTGIQRVATTMSLSLNLNPGRLRRATVHQLSCVLTSCYFIFVYVDVNN